MNLEIWLNKSVSFLKDNGISTARLDCLVLLEDATGKDRSYLLAHPEYKLDVRGGTSHKLDGWVERRAKHEPLAYIRGHSEFYGRNFTISKHTLEPRPESETIIDILKSHFAHLIQDCLVTDGENVNWVIIDVGTGSGCLGITAKLEMPGVRVLATDISSECIKIAKQNAKTLSADVAFYKGNLLEPLLTTIYDLRSTNLILIANLPYVPTAHAINQAAKYEPELAIFGGKDGLDLYRQMFKQSNDLALKPKYILTESLPSQHQKLAGIAKNVGYKLQKTDDFVQLFNLQGKHLSAP